MFFEFSLTNVLLAAILAVMLFERRKPVTRWFHERRMKKLVRHMMRPTVFYWNEHKGVVAVARADDYQRAADQHAERVNRGEVKPWEPMEFRVVPTFTFFVKEGARNFMHVGDRSDAESLMHHLLVASSFGMLDRADVRALIAHFGQEDVVGMISRKSPHLFVPYSSGDFAEQAKMFPKYEPDDVRAYLLKTRALPPVNPLNPVAAA